MKKNKKRAMVVAAIIASQLSLNSVQAQNQRNNESNQKSDELLRLKLYIKGEKNSQKLQLVACIEGNPVFKLLGKGAEALVTVDPETGDFRSVEPDFFLKLNVYHKDKNEIKVATKLNSGKSTRKPVSIKFSNGPDSIKILGVDIDGHIIQQTSSGEKFFLDPSTGDMVDYQGHVTLMR